MRTAAVLLTLAAAIGALVWWHTDRPPAAPAAGQTLDRYYTVRRGSFAITITQTGTLEAIKRHDLRCETSGREQLKIAFVIEDRTAVEKGDVILRADPQPFEQKLDQLLAELENQRKNLVLAQQDLTMRKSANLSNIKAAAEALRKAREEFSRYQDLTSVQKRRELQTKIDAAETKVERCRNQLAEAQEELNDAGWEETAEKKQLEEEVQKREIALRDAEVALEQAYHNLRVFKQYDYPQKVRELRENRAKTALNLEKVITESEANLIKERQRIQNYELHIRTLEIDLARLREDMGKLTIEAPIAGLVYHGNPKRRHWQEPKELKVGTQFHPREVLAYVPDLSQFQVKTDIPEEFRSRIETGLKARLRASALPDLEMTATIKEIAPVASHVVPWDKNSPKMYSTTLATDIQDERLTPGLTLEVEIIVKTVEDALFVPVEAVYHREGKTYCRRRDGASYDEIEIKAGEASIDYVAITEGLREGDQVLLSRPGKVNR